MQSKNRVVAILVLSLLFITGCGLKTQTLTEFYDKEFADVTKVVILDGTSGAKKAIADKAQIEEFLAKIKDIKFIPDEDQEKREGYLYSITFFQGKEQTFSFTPTDVNDHYYHTKPDIQPIIDETYKNLK